MSERSGGGSILKSEPGAGAATAHPARAAGASWARRHRTGDVTPARTGAARALRRRLDGLQGEFAAAYRALSEHTGRTPVASYASEWFLDNYHLIRAGVDGVEESLPTRFHRQLPRLRAPADPALEGLPRVHALAIALVDASACRPVPEELIGSVAGYQSVAPLLIGELWALPTMLRFVLLERLAAAIRTELGASSDPATPVGGADETVESCISSLRRLDAEDWKEFFERLSLVEEELRRDPSGVYPRMDFQTRDRYRKEVERVARAGPLSEVEVADVAIRLAGSPGEAPRDHVGFYLLGEGVRKLEREARCRLPLRLRVGRALQARPTVTYLGPILLGAAALLAAFAGLVTDLGAGPAALALTLLLGVVPALTVAVAAVNLAITQLVWPRVLPRMDLEDGVPAEARTLVVMPVLLTDADEIAELIERLERHYLTDPDPRIGYALLTDFADAPAQRMPGDRPLLDAARDGVEALNRRYGVSAASGPFHLLHRERRWSETESCWMGWERKRGKLEELNGLLRGENDTSFVLQVGSQEFLQDIRYVVTLDADTRIARDAVRTLIAIAVHPLNRPRHDVSGRVVAGYGILQPRMEILPEMANRSRFARLFSGDTGLDPYTLAVSDTYQDLFGEGIYVGKGLHDVDSFRASLHGRIPPSTLLSHDLIEGLYARPALVSDVVFFEDYPTHPLAQLLRAQRWIRGDWQLLPWLVRPSAGGLERLPTMKSVIGRWKIFDNLRRSLLAAALVALLTAGWLALPGPPALWTILAVATLAAPTVLGIAVSLARGPDDGVRSVAGDAATASLRITLALAFLPVEAAMSLRSILVTLWRVYVSRKHLLQWTTAANIARRGARAASLLRTRGYRTAVAFTLLVAALAWARGDGALAAAAPLLALWLSAPLLSGFMRRPAAPAPATPSAADAAPLRLLARRTWLYFETFVGPADHWLPPDNVQENGASAIAHRTSPTNIGLQLGATVSAFELGYVGVLDLVLRLRRTVDALEELPRYRGHLYNWYDTRSLAPLPPRYVSFVDSGNLAACLLTTASTCREVIARPAPDPRAWNGFADALAALAAGLDTVERTVDTERCRRCLQALRASVDGVGDHRPPDWAGALEAIRPAWTDLEGELLRLVRDAGPELPAEALEEIRTWGGRSRHHLGAIERELALLAPWVTALRSAPRQALRDAETDGPGAAWSGFVSGLPGVVPLTEVPSAVWQARERLSALRERVRAGNGAGCPPAVADWCDALDGALDLAEETARDTLGALHGLAERAEKLTGEMDFGFLYDRRRRLFHIGYRVDEETADPAHYDLLASEARVASLLAIAKHDVPVEHWRCLGRPFAVRQGRRVLLSWGGTAFEYLMPRLFMRSYHGTLLDQSCAAAVEIQKRYRPGRGGPWGVSESAYQRVDSAGVYQYKAFGVPDLGLKRGLGDELVVAPYASIIGLPYDRRAVLENLRVLEAEGALGRYGFYDAVDYTASRLPLGATRVVVRTFMAHHQAMSMIALCNILQDDVMVERFHADARVRTVEPLLQERLPARVMTDRAPPAPHAPPPRPQRAAQAWRATSEGPVPAAHYLSNGRYGVLITAAGGGQSRWNGVALTRWRADPTLEDLGHWIYVRDWESGRLWSLARQPVSPSGGEGDALFFPHKVQFRRREGAITGRLEVVVGVADDVEIRRVTLTNSSDRAKAMRVSSYAEVALAEQAADRRHPAFQKLFVEARAVLDGHGLVFRRRPRQSDDPASSFAHAVVFDAGSASSVALCADREAFLGRGRTAARPVALEAPSAATQAREHRPSAWETAPEASLDPVHAVAVDVTVPPHSSLRLAYISAAGSSDEEAIRLLSGYTAWSRVEAAIDQARVQAEQEMRRFDLTSPAIAGYQRLLSALLFRDPGLGPHRGRGDGFGPHIDPSRPGVFDRSALWAHGISGDHPILLIRLEEPDHLALVQTVLGAHAFWRRRGLRVDLVIVDTRTSGYDLDIQNKLDRLLIRRGDDAHLGERGGIFVVRAALLSPGEVDFLRTRAAVVLDGAAGPLESQLAAAADPTPPRLPVFRPSHVGHLAPDPPVPTSEPGQLQFPTPWGGFSRDGREYVIRVADASPGARPPVPWCNVVANESFGFLATESSLGCTWAGNSGENRLSPWGNDPVSDPPSETVYLRDEETAAIWSATPSPAGGGAAYEVAHGPGYTRYDHFRHGLRHTLTAFTDAARPIKYLVLDLHNATSRPRRLTVTYYLPWVLGADREETRAWVVPSYEPAHDALLARAAADATFGHRVAFAASTRRLHGLTADRREFLGRLGTRERPAGLVRIGLSGTVRPGLDPCAAIQVHVDLEPHAGDRVVFLLGQGDDRAAALGLVEEARRPGAVEDARAAVEAHWDRTLRAVRVSTPDPAFDLLLNRWLPYQILACRVWARSGFYQSSGAYGFRDQLQDVMALCHARPDIAREHILRAAAHQFAEGDVLHWWHPPTDRGVRTRISDDLLWLPYATAHYVETTGDVAILDEPAPFLVGAPLDPGVESRYASWSTSADVASLLEHCRRAIEKGSTAGPHGLPLIGAGDWNDGLNRVGVEGRGESVWLGWFLHDVLRRFARLSRARGLSRDADAYLARAAALAEAIEASGWDGEWYRRAYYDDGTPLGSSSSLECRIDAIAQSWSVLSGAAPVARQRRALAALAENLVREDARVSLLLAPPFDRTPRDPGYIKGYRPGVRENGGQYTHAAVWTAWAFAQRGDAEAALRLFGHASPIRHTETPERARRYRAEPYATAGDIYGAPPWLGRGGWTWYTGSAAWLYRLGLERILGLRREGAELRIDPRVPAAWREFRIEYGFGTARYLIDVRIAEDGGGVAAAAEVVVDGRPEPDGAIPLVDDGREHAVRVTLPADGSRVPGVAG